nr:carboxypeptidase-like regulatory domain-containing protein [Gemmatales bacterium]
GPDGKRPADPVQVEGVRLPDSTTLWAAELPLPAESKGVLQVGFTATNEVGLQVTETKNIKLVDAPPPAGNLHVKVLRGSLPQIGLLVKLKDAEGKDKAVATTNNKGIAEFKQLPPGLYSVSAAKADSGVGSKAETAGKVEVDKTTEVKLELRRGNP